MACIRRINYSVFEFIIIFFFFTECLAIRVIKLLTDVTVLLDIILAILPISPHNDVAPAPPLEKMERGLQPTLFLLLLLWPKGAMLSHSNCPYRCQCFTPIQVLCADEHMTSVPKNISREAKELVIMTSALHYLFPSSFEEGLQLHKLVFFNNQLQNIHSQAFHNLSELEELDISGNPWLENLFLGTFSKQENLTKLQLNYNKFQTLLPGIFNSLKHLETLEMKANTISVLPPFLFQKLQNLRVLDLSLNRIQNVERETLSGLTGLEILKMSNNQISNISSDTFHHVGQLMELHLEGNRISELDDEIFSAFTKLKVLNLRRNHLLTFSGQVFGRQVSNLTELDLRGNRLTRVSAFSLLKSLTDVLLSSNQLSSLPDDIFRNVTTLENLDLSENQLTSLPDGIFDDLKSIKIIHLHKNKLSSLDPGLFKDQGFIQQLYLSENQLQNLPPGLLDHFALPHILRLYGNPWKCDCHMWYLHDFVLNNDQDIEMPDRMLCENPEFLRRRSVASIGRDELLCHLPRDERMDLSSCSLQKSGDSLLIKCKVDKCSPLTVKVQFLERNGSTREHIWKNDGSECSNVTISEVPMP
ncbi:carboxypeptidase N subunit 2 [Syngnathoides biaculeatus]|uniref:carboxypeptidase N subunit 2 n=1 Tax=Syngnathoides biaculeatus TaxID=300417 RepID=UPI002ADDA60A|nr:carboxypeptidase N subunit 2 [Syngnathoides biaculeatus]